MSLVDSVSRYTNYGITSTDKTVKEIVKNPSAVKKVLQLAGKIFAAFDLYFVGHVKPREITNVMKGTTQLIEFYGSYKNIMYWINPFSKDSLDQETLKKSLEEALCAYQKGSPAEKRSSGLVDTIFTEVLAKEAYYSYGEVLNVIQTSLIGQGYQENQIQSITSRVIIQQKSRPLIQLISSAIFTLTDLGDNLLTLKKWNVLDLSHIAASIGSKSRVFAFIAKRGVDTVLGVGSAAGLVLVVGETAYRTVKQGMNYYSSDDKTKQAYQDLRKTLLDLLSSSLDLAATAAPLLMTLNPPVLVAMAIVSKATGLVCMLAR